MVIFWERANRQLIAKALGELTYEQILNPQCTDSTEKGRQSTYELFLSSGIVYEFRAWQTVWGDLRVAEQSISRVCDGQVASVNNAGQFFVDAQVELQMDNITLGNFLEEMHNSLWSEAQRLQARGEELWGQWWQRPVEQREGLLAGHPKILLNKGRLGWGEQALQNYAPESLIQYQLHYVAVHKDYVITGEGNSSVAASTILQCLSEEELKQFCQVLSQRGASPEDFLILPVHPWQEERFLKIQYAEMLARGEMVFLGAAGDLYSPQASIRTLSNRGRPQKHDVKLSLSILNTSAVRGLGSRYMSVCAAVSQELDQLCREDELLQSAGVQVLQELHGFSVPHPRFQQVKEAPYRYQEFFGGVFRQSVSSQLAPDETAIMTGALYEKDGSGQTLLENCQQRSGISLTEWLGLYFTKVVVPLYHLQLRYGIGLVAHGQNVILKLCNDRPCGVILKDFMGDLRITDDLAVACPLRGFAPPLESLPPQYLIHDLQTGHFVTVLRFLSGALQESVGFPEQVFYRILHQVLQKYRQDYHPQGVHPSMDLLQPKVKRVLLNRVRFHIGYQDSVERPRPMLGDDLDNPLIQEGGYDEHPSL
jgi:aerobactin synthase